MIYSSTLGYNRQRFGAGQLNINGSNPYFNATQRYIQLHANNKVNSTTSYPTGYRAGTAIYLPIIDGGLSGRIICASDTTSGILGVGYMEGTVTISITTSADGNLLANIGGTITITISVSGVVIAYGYISGTLETGAIPSAEDIAQAVWSTQLPGGFETGSAADKLSSAGAAGDPWSIEIPGTYTQGQAGNILGNLLSGIPDSVWNELKTTHTVGSSYGKIVQDLEKLSKQIKALTAAGL
jgi:hypothetical protein